MENKKQRGRELANWGRGRQKKGSTAVKAMEPFGYFSGLFAFYPLFSRFLFAFVSFDIAEETEHHFLPSLLAPRNLSGRIWVERVHL